MTQHWRAAARPSEPEQVLADFLAEEAPLSEPAVLLPAVLARTALARRRPAWRVGSWWSDVFLRRGRPLTNERTTMFTAARFLIPVFLVLAGGWYLVGTSPGTVQVAGAPSPTASPIPMSPGTELQAGASYAMTEPFLSGSPTLIFTVPGSGWTSVGEFNIGKDVVPTSIVPDYHDIAMTPWLPDNLVLDPCHWQTGGVVDPPVGPSVDDLAGALAAQGGENATSPTDIVIGGYAGKRVEVSMPAETNISLCPGGDFGRWLEAGAKGGHTYGNGQHNVVYILDVDGIRGVIDTMYLPGVPESDIAEMEALVASIRFEWPEPSPSPGLSAGASTSP